MCLQHCIVYVTSKWYLPCSKDKVNIILQRQCLNPKDCSIFMLLWNCLNITSIVPSYSKASPFPSPPLCAPCPPLANPFLYALLDQGGRVEVSDTHHQRWCCTVKILFMHPHACTLLQNLFYNQKKRCSQPLLS